MSQEPTPNPLRGGEIFVPFAREFDCENSIFEYTSPKIPSREWLGWVKKFDKPC